MSHLPGVGICGTGPQATLLVPLLKKEGFRVEAIWGLTREEAETVAKRLDIPYSTTRIDDVLLRKDVDLIVVACPPAHHSQIAVKALGIGKHVAVQSPGGLSQDEAMRMVQAAQYYPRLLSVLNHGLRFHPAFVKMRAAVRPGGGSVVGPRVNYCDVRIDTGSLVGERYSWLCDDAMGGGVLNLFGAHAIDLVSWLTGQRAVRAHGVVRTFRQRTDKISGIRQISADDCCNFQLEMEGGAFATVALNAHRGRFAQEVLLLGDGGSVVARNGDLFCRKDGEEEETCLHLETKSEEKTRNPLMPSIYLDGMAACFSNLASRFASNAVNGGSENAEGNSESPAALELASLEDAQYVQAVIEAVRASSREKTWTKISHLEWWR